METVREKVIQTIGEAGKAPSGAVPFTPRVQKVLELALNESVQLGHRHIGPEHLLLGIVRDAENVAATVLVRLGADLLDVRTRTLRLLSGGQ
jgi:ATP-dependent Clp protease ATP-binding subunit ClpC